MYLIICISKLDLNKFIIPINISIEESITSKINNLIINSNVFSLISYLKEYSKNLNILLETLFNGYLTKDNLILYQKH